MPQILDFHEASLTKRNSLDKAPDLGYIARGVKKEVLIAIIIGFGLGLVITFGIWGANRNFNNKEARDAASTEAPEVAATPPVNPDFFLNVNYPENELLVDQEMIRVTGATTADSVVVILFEGGESVLEADSEGKFETEIELAAGVNNLTVIATDNQGREIKKEISVVYSTAEI